MNRLRALCRAPHEVDIKTLGAYISKINPEDRLLVIAEVLMDLQDDEVNYQSCGCYDFDITMDYRNAEERK